jgi:hypothetical protein
MFYNSPMELLGMEERHAGLEFVHLVCDGSSCCEVSIDALYSQTKKAKTSAILKQIKKDYLLQVSILEFCSAGSFLEELAQNHEPWTLIQRHSVRLIPMQRRKSSIPTPTHCNQN